MTEKPSIPPESDESSTLTSTSANTNETHTAEESAPVAVPELDVNLIHRALANPFRREVLRWLKTPDQDFAPGKYDCGCGVPANAIHARSGLSQSTVSAHIAALVDAQLLVSNRVGQWMFLARNEDVIRAFATQISLQL
jgi:DNA-binding transcriptional ArsR family regulator